MNRNGTRARLFKSFSMKKSFVRHLQSVLLGGMVALSAGFSLEGQDFYSTKPYNIFEALSARQGNEGKVFIRQPRELRAFVGKVDKNASTAHDIHENIKLRIGYRIQVYNGNLPNSKKEAYDRASKVSKHFPENMCYISYKAPFWRLVVGDYTSIEEAREALGQLKDKLPNIANELYIVKDKIRSFQ